MLASLGVSEPVGENVRMTYWCDGHSLVPNKRGAQHIRAFVVTCLSLTWWKQCFLHLRYFFTGVKNEEDKFYTLQLSFQNIFAVFTIHHTDP